MIRTENFNPDSDPKLLCTCGHPDCDKRSVSQEVLEMVQLVRNKACRPLIVNSGGRCEHHPDELVRITPADHQKCNGIDIAVKDGIERYEIVELGIKYGFNAIGVAKTFIHLGYREMSVPVMWSY